MGKYIISGGNRLSGKIAVESAKNSVLPILAASILTDKTVVIKNCPKISDVLSMIKILQVLGVKTQFKDNDLIIDSANLSPCEVNATLTKELRSSIFMLGALISRTKSAKLSYPGGCEIGLRPIDIHIDGLRKLGVKITENDNEINCQVDQIFGASIRLKFPSVGATENLIMASVISTGTTVLYNCAKEPEIIDLANFLNSMGAKIQGAGTGTITIEGVKKLHGTTFTPMGDRIEAGTFLLATLITGGEIEISNVKKENIFSLVDKVCNNACKININSDIIYIKSKGRCNGVSFITETHPGFPTDLQAPFMTLNSVSSGRSIIKESVFEMRFRYVNELKKMGANIRVFGNTAIVDGVNRLHGASVKSCDLRGGAAMVLAGLNAEGITIVNDVRHIERGYLDFDRKLNELGAVIKKIT